MRFTVKRNPFLVLLMLSLIPISILVLYESIRQEGNLVSAVVAVFLMGFGGWMLWTLIRSHYEITSDKLYVVFGLQKIEVPLSEIRQVRYTYNLMAAPAWSPKRLEITYNQYDLILVSAPKDEAAFFRMLKERCQSGAVGEIERKLGVPL
ncbi:PH domain-containing protein [Microbacteriaceae bacterium 4G12]